jgi:hypothetical protein
MNPGKDCLFPAATGNPAPIHAFFYSIKKFTVEPNIEQFHRKTFRTGSLQRQEHANRHIFPPSAQKELL